MRHYLALSLKSSQLPALESLTDDKVKATLGKISRTAKAGLPEKLLNRLSIFNVGIGFHKKECMIYVVRDGQLTSVTPQVAHPLDLEVIAGTLCARGWSASRNDASHEPSRKEVIELSSWHNEYQYGDGLFTWLLDMEADYSSLFPNAGQRLVRQAIAYQDQLVHLGAMAACSGINFPDNPCFKRSQSGPLRIVALTPEGRDDIIISHDGATRALRPYNAGLSHIWVNKPLKDECQREIYCLIAEGLQRIDMERASELLLVHGYTVTGSSGVKKPYRWNSKSWSPA